MKNKMRGFTLIEMVIVIAIIGILASLLLPSAMEAIQKARQKQGMAEMHTMSGAVVDYLTDHGNYDAIGAQAGPMLQAGAFQQALGFYVQVAPVKDPWGTDYQAFLGKDAVESVVTGITDAGPEDFAFVSYGRDHVAGPRQASDYSRTTQDAGFYNVSKMADFDNDLAVLNGSWIVGPRTSLVTGS